jgi:hypothetical protein
LELNLITPKSMASKYPIFTLFIMVVCLVWIL